MNANFPTVDLFFVFAFTYCKLSVYKGQEHFARKVLEAHDVEFLTSKDSNSWQEIDTRVLLDLVGQALPKMIGEIFSQPAQVASALGLENISC